MITSYRSDRDPYICRGSRGYIHLPGTFHSQKNSPEAAVNFEKKKLPVDLLVRDWQYWGKYGWNAMRFDETRLSCTSK